MRLPILYTFRRCPYAIRTRMALRYAGICCEIREVVLRNKPSAMLEISPKGSVPVLLLPDDTVLEESLDIMLWALVQQDSEGWQDFDRETLEEMSILIKQNDTSFKQALDRYKYYQRYPEQPVKVYRQAGEKFLQKLELRLKNGKFLFGSKVSLADIAIFPFIRQFSKVDLEWFQNSPYERLKQWLRFYEESELFASVMHKYEAWYPGADVEIFNEGTFLN